MRIACAMLAASVAAAAFAEGEPVPVRNPFWPIGYEGEREVITPEPRVKISLPTAPGSDDDTQTAVDAASVAAAAAAAVADLASPQHWVAARKTLAVGSPMIVKGPDGVRRSSVMINGRAYADGDFVSVTHNGRRFTWKVMGLNDSDVLKLVRTRVRKVEEPEQGSEKGKGK